MTAAPIAIIDFEPHHAAAFRTLNHAWITRYFHLEPHDHEMLDDPEGYILRPGGCILMACLGDDMVGTCALIREADDRYELAKMAVDDRYQGRGIGRALGEAAVVRARQLGARWLVLESNRRLAPALNLYRQLGFREVPIDPGTPYSRADIRMELALEVDNR